MTKFLYLPIESKVRELDAKILIALEAISNEYTVIIGSKSLIKRLKLLPEGILFYKDSSSIMENIFKNTKEYGHKIVVHDEEGFVQMNWNDYCRLRIEFNTLKYVDKYFCWGKEQLQAISNVKDTFNKKLVLNEVGHSRIDILRQPLREYNNINKKTTKKVILINTKLAEYNHILGKDAWLNIMREHNMLLDETFTELKKDQVQYKKILMKEYVNLIKRLALVFPEYKIILRPHPSENIQNWKDIVLNCKNVIVTNEKSIGYWIHQADVVIHTGCSTAIEAFIMDKPIISYNPLSDNRFDEPLPDSISFKSTNIDDCCNQIEKLIGQDYDKKKYKDKGNKILSANISSLEGEFAYKKIIKEIDDLKPTYHNFSIFNRLYIRSLFLKQYVKDIFVKSGQLENKTFRKKDILETINKLKNVKPEKNEIIINKLHENLFLLHR